MTQLLELLKKFDDQLSNRYIDLDPGGYWIIYIDPETQLIGLKHYRNAINEKGLAVDPDTGEVIPCQGPVNRLPTLTLQGKTAKELCVKLFEEMEDCPITMLNHAAYLGRELVRAELALIQGTDYVQD
jgi:dihydropteroate synthase